MQPQTRSISTLSNDANGVCEDQTTAGAGDLTLNGALVSGGVATMSEAQPMSIESAGNLSGVTFTITGTDADGRTQTEAVTGPNATTVTSSEYFKTVTGIAVDGAVGTNVEIGPLSTNGGVTKTVAINHKNCEAGTLVSLSVVSTGTATFTVQHTFNNIQDFDNELVWFDNSGLSAKTASTDGNIAFPAEGVRLEVTSYTSGTLTLTVLQG